MNPAQSAQKLRWRANIYMATSFVADKSIAVNLILVTTVPGFQ